jgi:hypothetical protein
MKERPNLPRKKKNNNNILIIRKIEIKFSTWGLQIAVVGEKNSVQDF